jgi:dTDP-4-amino-4,6-dideoxygalactose transaminase
VSAVAFGDLSREYRHHHAEIDAAVQRVLTRGWFVLGEEGAGFEAEFARYLGAAHAVGVGNGTDAIRIALEACGVAPGDEVVTVPFTAVPTVTAITMLGAQPRFVDVRPDTATMDPAALEAAITPATRAIVPVHLYGAPCDMAPILAVAGRHGVPIVEDAAQAHGTTYRGRRVGTFGLAGCFSFYPSKNLGAYGDGGAVVSDDAAVAERCRMIRNYGQRRRYEHVTKGVNSRLDEIQAAILRAKLPYLDAWNERRRAIADRYDAAILATPQSGAPTATAPGDPALRVLARPEGHVCHLYSVVCRDRADAQAFLAARGVGTQVHYPTAVHLQPAYADLGLGPGAYPHSERLAHSVLSLPMYPFLEDDEVDAVCAALRDYCRQDPAGR